MRIVALETSTEYCSVALWQDGTVTAISERVGQKHSEVLMAMLDRLLGDAGITLKQLNGIAFGMGPGSFTGVRIACGVAQGLALGADIPVVGVCTLEALAEASGKSRVLAALDARMGELYLAAYERIGGEWKEVVAPCLCDARTAPAISGTGWFGAGSGFATQGDELRVRYDIQLQEIDSSLVPQAAAISVLAAARFAAGEGKDAAEALPLYLRNKVALTTRERDAL